MNYNPYFPGAQIAMAAPLSDDGVEYNDGTKATVEQMSKDITAFLIWTAEPELEERKRLGLKVMLFLIVFSAMLYAVKRQVWAKLH
jgi:cytochrome c1